MTFDAPLHVIDEADVLPSLGDADIRGPLSVVGMARRSALDASSDQNPARLGGEAAACWPCDPAPPAVSAPVLCRVRDVLHFPAFGALVQASGQNVGGVYAAASGEALHRWPDLAGLPHVETGEGGPRLTLTRDPPVLPAGAVFMPWGGAFNYGHFVLDALTSLLALEEAEVLEGVPVLAPRLKRWQRALLDLTCPGLAIRELSAPIVRLETALYATSMNHFLHAPDAVVARLAQRILARAGPGADGPRTNGPRRVYLSRRGQSMRVMVNEVALEAALARRGFVIARPERLSPERQIALMRGAQVVVAPTGAALANAIFMPAGARVIEIQPENFASRWVWAACRQVGVDWSGYVCRSPVDPSQVALLNRLRRGFRFGYRPPLDDLLAFIDAAL